MSCPYCNKSVESHESVKANVYTLYFCDKMPEDGRIWCIPELHISINPSPKRLI